MTGVTPRRAINRWRRQHNSEIAISVSASNTAPGLRRARWIAAIDGAQRPHTLMALWGVAIGLVTALALMVVVPHEWPVLGSRATGMRASLSVLREGGPLLAGRHGLTGAYYAVALNDDPGSFVYLPWLGHLLGGVDPTVMLSYCYVALIALLAAVYPLIFYTLTRSLLAGLASPLMLVICILSIGVVDIDWIPAWGMLALLPVLYLLARRWPRHGLLALVAISLAAGWLSSIRSSSGLGIVVIAAIMLTLRRWRWWRLLPALALLAAAYMATSTFLFTAIREHRDQRLGVKSMPDDQVTQHPLYHTAYIGLGYLPNNYGIRYVDSAAAARVQNDAPGTHYGTRRYDTVIRRAYFDFVQAHPLEALRQYGAKAVVAVANAGPYLLVILLTMPAMLMLGPDRRMRRLWVLLTLPAVIIGFLQPMVAIPGREYDAELVGVLGVLGILGCCSVIAFLEAEARRRGRLSFTRSELDMSLAGAHRGPVVRSLRISAATFAVLVLVGTAGYFIRQRAFHWQGSSPSLLMRYLGAASNNPA